MSQPSQIAKGTPHIIAKKYIIKEEIGHGTFGRIYKATAKKEKEQVAIKLEKQSALSAETLLREIDILLVLKREIGFPELIAHGKEHQYNYAVIELLGNNLENLFEKCAYKFSLKTCLMIIDQMMTRIEVLHKKGFLHRDIKPENFCIGNNNRDLYLIDFGLSKSYTYTNGEHIEFSKKKGLVGTARYASVNCHLFFEQSRRDDLEALGYLMIYLMKGKLLWQDCKAETKNEKYKLILDMKQKSSIPLLCFGLPSAFCKYMTYVKSLSFVQEPDYAYLKKLFTDLFYSKEYAFDYKYDWVSNLKEEDKQLNVSTFETQVRGVSQDNLALRCFNTEYTKADLTLVHEDEKEEEKIIWNKAHEKPSAKSINVKYFNCVAKMPYESFIKSQTSVFDSNTALIPRSSELKYNVKAKSAAEIQKLKNDNTQNFITEDRGISQLLNLQTELDIVEDESEIPTEMTFHIAPDLNIQKTSFLQPKAKLLL